MNLYIIMTVDIHPIGGNQLFTNEITKYFSRLKDWDVRIVHYGSSLGNCKIVELNNYLNGGSPMMYFYKPSQIEQDVLENIYRNTLSNLEIKIENYDEILIGAQNNNMAVWGEFFARKMNAQMICFDVTEVFRGPGFCYEEYIDFFKHKFYRNELFSLDINKLFEGYMTVSNPSYYKMYATEGNPIQDIENSKIKDVYKEDFNISYIGRTQKKYFPSIVRGVAQFAQKYKDKSIQFIIVGDAEPRLQLLNNKLLCLPNVKLLNLGDMFPIPRELYDKVDVVVAGSGAANYSSREKAPVIVIDADNCKANGILGYTCNIDECLYHKKENEQSTVLEALEDVLIYKTYVDSKIELSPLPDSKKRIDNMLDKFKSAIQDKVYYPVEKKVDEKILTKADIPVFSEDLNVIKTKIDIWKKNDLTIVFGIGNEGKQCFYWLKNINVKIDAYVDNNKSCWYTEMNGVDVFPVDYLDSVEGATIIISSDIYGDEMLQQLKHLKYDQCNNIVKFSDLKKYDWMVLLNTI